MDEEQKESEAERQAACEEALRPFFAAMEAGASKSGWKPHEIGQALLALVRESMKARQMEAEAAAAMEEDFKDQSAN